MIKEVRSWMTEDGLVFATIEEAEAHQVICERLNLIETVLSCDLDRAIEVYDFIKKYTKGWK